jgi:hypothetical protein
MAYLDNTSVIVDAILTRKGRELLARGQNEFNITHFALADDEIDYSLWNADHPLGSNYYGTIIENLPITEAVPDETQLMRYKLVTLPRKTLRIPIIDVPQKNVTLSPGQSVQINPQTINYTQGNTTFGYTFILGDSDVVTMNVDTIASGNNLSANQNNATSFADGEVNTSVTKIGKTITLTANLLLVSAKSTTLTIIGNETGGRVVVNITVVKQTTNLTPDTPLDGVRRFQLP